MFKFRSKEDNFEGRNFRPDKNSGNCEVLLLANNIKEIEELIKYQYKLSILSIKRFKNNDK